MEIFGRAITRTDSVWRGAVKRPSRLFGNRAPKGSPCLHPLTPIIGEGHLFVFMEPTSPKGHDLQRDGRFAILCSVSDTSGTSGEFGLTGRAHFVDDPEIRPLAESLAPYAPSERYILFEFDVESAASTIYPEDRPVRQFWKREI